MRFEAYTDVRRFYDATYDVLMGAEAQNLIILGNVVLGNAGTDTYGWRDPAGWFMATVSDAASVQLVALMTPPYNITLYEAGDGPDPEALACLVDGIASAGVAIGGVTSEASLATRLAAAYVAANGRAPVIKTRQRIYELTAVDS